MLSVVVLQVTRRSAIKGARATLLLVAMVVMVVTTTATMQMEAITTVATTVATAAVPQATMAMVAMEATLKVVSLFIIFCSKQCLLAAILLQTGLDNQVWTIHSF